MARIVALLGISMLVMQGSCLGPSPRKPRPTTQVPGDAASPFTSNGDAMTASTDQISTTPITSPLPDMVGTCECKWAKKPGGCDMRIYKTHCKAACCRAQQNQDTTTVPARANDNKEVYTEAPVHDEDSVEETESKDENSGLTADAEGESPEKEYESEIQRNTGQMVGGELEKEALATEKLALQIDRKALDVKEQAEKARMRTQELDFAADKADAEFQNLQAKSLHLSDQARKLNEKAELLNKQAEVLMKGKHV